MWMQHSLHRILLQFFFLIEGSSLFVAADAAIKPLLLLHLLPLFWLSLLSLQFCFNFLALIFSEMSCCLHCLLCLLSVCVGVCGAMNLQGHKVHLAYGGTCIAQVWKPEGDAKGQQCQ